MVREIMGGTDSLYPIDAEKTILYEFMNRGPSPLATLAGF